ncbi:MAG TPA: helix-turn-helix domain-containing protein [Bacteroidales bacterium]
MENLVFTQLSVQEVRQMLREEVRNVIKECNPLEKPDDEYDLMTIQEVAGFINMAVTSVYGLVHRKQIPHIKRGKRLIFEKKQIIEWLQSGRQKTIHDIQSDADTYLRNHSRRHR